MSEKRIHKYALRAVNQYRRRDILSYLALRYYLENDAARTEEWAENIAVDLVLTNYSFNYFKIAHFKEIDKLLNVSHRTLFLPTANVSIAEAALLDQCSKNTKLGALPECVFSYELAEDVDVSGVFKSYMEGLSERQRCITSACNEIPNGIVKHIDIRNFYPSIKIKLVNQKWLMYATDAGLAAGWVRLGSKLIEGYSRSENSSGGLLVGPMFCHFLANLVLREIDKKSTEFGAKYFRYVDDITLVGTEENVDSTIKILRAELDLLGLEMHTEDSPKTISSTVEDWLKYKDDFSASRSGRPWMEFVGNLKRFLLLNRDQAEPLNNAFLEIGMRIPIIDYSIAATERRFVEKFIRFFHFLKNKTVHLSLEILTSQAI